MKILAIETSCDETGLALLGARGGIRAPEFSVFENLVASQIPIHRPFGGVVPNLAKREHLKNLPLLLEEAAGKGLRFKDIDLIAVTVGPGLEPALWTGINFAKTLAKEHKKKLVGVNHLEGHLYSFLLRQKAVSSKSQIPNRKLFPSIALIASGGHTVLLRVESFSKWKRLGETRDDAAGEAFDKVARLLDLPYPGGPEIEKLAEGGDPSAVAFPRPMLHEKNYDFSFSGLKTAVLYYIRENEGVREVKKFRADVAASFQQAAVDVLVAKTMRAVAEYSASSVILCGGVAANGKLKSDMCKATKGVGVPFSVPDAIYNFDNAAMIGAAGYMAYLRKKKYRLAAQGTLDI